MDGIEQMMLSRANELEQIAGGMVTLSCQFYKNHSQSWFSWTVGVRTGNCQDVYAIKHSYSELKERLKCRVNEVNEGMELRRLYDPIAMGM